MAPRPWQKRSPDAPGKTQLVTARLSPDKIETLKNLDGSLSYHVRQAIELYIKTKKPVQDFLDGQNEQL
jgi:hypothetical protein